MVWYRSSVLAGAKCQGADDRSIRDRTHQDIFVRTETAPRLKIIDECRSRRRRFHGGEKSSNLTNDM
jgi:hypothetical protein